MNIFNEGKEQNVAQALNAKDKCVALQQKIFANFRLNYVAAIFHLNWKYGVINFS